MTSSSLMTQLSWAAQSARPRMFGGERPRNRQRPATDDSELKHVSLVHNRRSALQEGVDARARARKVAQAGLASPPKAGRAG